MGTYADKVGKLDRQVKNQRAKERRQARLVERRKEANERQAIADKLTPTQRIAKLDRKLGNGQGAAKERKRLLEKSSVGLDAKVRI